MFKQISQNVWAFDVEWVPDSYVGRRLYLLPNEMEEANNINAVKITNNNKSLNVMELTGLIMNSEYIIANDTGPAHIAAHVNKSGLVLFGRHTTPKKVSIETEKFKALSVEDLQKLEPDAVYREIKNNLDLIN